MFHCATTIGYAIEAEQWDRHDKSRRTVARLIQLKQLSLRAANCSPVIGNNAALTDGSSPSPSPSPSASNSHDKWLDVIEPTAHNQPIRRLLPAQKHCLLQH